MDENDDYYVEFNVSGMIKTSKDLRVEVIERIQFMLSELLDDDDLNIIRFDESFTMSTGNDIISDMFGSDENDDSDDDLDVN